MRTILIPNHLSPETTAPSIRRDYPGDNDCIRAIAVYSLENGQIKMIEMEEKTQRGIDNYSWSPDGSRLLIDQSSENAVHRWIYVVNMHDYSTNEIWHDIRDSRIWQIGTSEWRSEGLDVLFISDHNGFNHLFSLPLGHPTPNQLTEGNWEIIDVRGRSVSMKVSENTKDIYFIATKKSPYERHVYKLPEKGGPILQVTFMSGCDFDFALSPDGSKLAVLHSSDTTPIELYISDTQGDSSERRITYSPAEEFYSHKWIEPRYVTFKSHIDGTLLHGRLMQPTNLDESKKYPVICGPIYSDTVRNQWDSRFGSLQQLLVLEGQYLVFQVDLRRSSGYGNTFRDSVKYDLGGIDLEDLHSGVKYLQTLSYVDPDRIGVCGTSYGGLVTVLSLFKKPGVYKAGVAGAPATNCWHANAAEVRNFGRPDTHPEALRKASAICYGENLQDHLMIIHGMQDSVVQFRDSVALVEKLMILGKDVDLVVAPSANHGWSRKNYAAVYLFNKLIGHFDRYLGRGPR